MTVKVIDPATRRPGWMWQTYSNIDYEKNKWGKPPPPVKLPPLYGPPQFMPVSMLPGFIAEDTLVFEFTAEPETESTNGEHHGGECE